MFITFREKLPVKTGELFNLNTKKVNAAIIQGDTFNGKTLNQFKPAQSALINFLGKNKHSNTTHHDYQEYNSFNSLKDSGVEYKNLFETQLKATPNPNLRRELSSDKNVVDLNKAELRIKSLSRYLKEDMVGFITPSGDHWFEGALQNFIFGAEAKRIPENQFKSAAKEFWSLLAKADDYWSSDDFINYLDSMKSSPAQKATIDAIKEIQNERSVKSDISKLVSALTFGYSSQMKDIQKLLNDGCAYSGVKMVRHGRNPSIMVSAEHIFPHSKGGQDSDLNYLMASAQENGDRGNMPLVDFLRGHTQE